MTRPLLLSVALLAALGAAACAPPGPAAPPSGMAGPAAFASLAVLAGDWQASTPKGAIVRASYRLVANGSALVETYTPPSGKETLTIFHRDGAAVVATHYCAQGNQPRLVLASAEPARFRFEFWDATNLASPGASHLVRLDLAVRDPDHYDKTEVYIEGGKEDVSTLAFVRARPAAP